MKSNKAKSPKSAKTPRAVATLPAGRPILTQHQIADALRNAVRMVAEDYQTEGGTVSALADQLTICGMRKLFELANDTGESIGSVLHRCLILAAPVIRDEIAAKNMANQLDTIIEADEEPDVDALGFYKGKLVWCGGRSYEPVTLAESLKLYIRIAETEGCTSSNGHAIKKWLRMLSAKLEGKAAK